jgi:type IV secretory pathway TrbD component
VLITAMLWREWRTIRSLPRAIFILTDGLALILIFHIGLWGFAIIAMNHWLVAIGLASHVHANREGVSPWPFALGLCLAGLLLFAALFVDPVKLLSGGISTAMLSFSAAAVGFRLGLGFVHFLYDRWIWRLSDPQVRATIGRDLFPETRLPQLALAAE